MVRAQQCGYYQHQPTANGAVLGLLRPGKWITGSPKLERYNGVPSVELLRASPAPGQSTGSAITEMQKLVAKLPPGFGYEWTGLSYEQVKSGSQTTLLYSLAMIVVFLCLAALYESWAIPVAVILVVPLGVMGAVLATWLRGMNNDVYFQVGLLTTIGLSAKNAILIVEFAKANYDAGKSLVDAAAIAARERLRPILMTSLAFILGVLPLAISTGAGSGGQNAIGTGVVGGMIAATILAVILVPVFFVAVLGLFRVKPGKAGTDGPSNPAPAPWPACLYSVSGGCTLSIPAVRRGSHLMRAFKSVLWRASLAALLSGGLVSGCTLDPDISRPSLPVPIIYPRALLIKAACGCRWQPDRGSDRLARLLHRSGVAGADRDGLAE